MWKENVQKLLIVFQSLMREDFETYDKATIKAQYGFATEMDQ